MANLFKSLLLDSRTEWALRYTVLHAIFYVLYFYPPSFNSPLQGGVVLDWSLPVQLISGGNLAFYNAGWQAWFGLGCGFAMVAAGIIVSVVFPLLKEDNLGGAYVALMAMLCAFSLPLVSYIGVLNNLRSIAFLLVIIFTEVFYGPILNFTFLGVFQTQHDIWIQVVAPNVIPALAFVAIGWGVYALPPWHSGTYQMLQLTSQVTGGVAGCLNGAAELLRSKDNDDKDKTSKKAAFRSMANTLLQQTSYAGLYVPISLYGDMGVYETSAFYPHLSLRADSFQRLGKYLDQTVFLVAVQLWALGEVIDEVVDQELLEAAAKQLDASAELTKCIASVLACPRKTYRKPADGGFREGIATNPALFDVAGISEIEPTETAKSRLREASQTAAQVVGSLKDTTETSSNKFAALLLYNITSDLTTGQKALSHYKLDHDLEQENGALGRLMKVAETLQESWTDDSAWPRMFYRLTYLEQFTDLVVAWVRGVWALLTCNLHPSLSRKRTLARFLQFLIGTMGLYAMATWWPEYSSLLGSSSTGQWTMVAFYVCLRATAEETVNAGILRGIGHGLGGMLSWGINSAVESSGGRIGCHLAFTFAFTWLIPPPFCVTPTLFAFKTDILFTNTLEGLLTTYHLTSVLVLSTDIESAAKARALSQCIGAATAVVLSLVILPWFARSEATKTLESFKVHCKKALAGKVDAKAAAASVERLLQARRDVAGAEEAASWIPSKKDSSGLGESLIQTAFGSFAVEAILLSIQPQGEGEHIPEEIISALKECKLKEALSCIRDSITSSPEPRDDLAALYIEVLLLRESMLAN